MTLTEDQVAFFRREGYLVAEGVLASSDLEPVIAGYREWVDQRAEALLAEGKIADICAAAPFETRIGALTDQCSTAADGMDIMQARLRPVFELLYNDPLLDAVSALVGPNLTCNPIQHIRAKPPARVQQSGYYNVPWHQDAAVTWEEADSTEIVTCWIALVDATVENGCMEVLPRAFSQGYLPHHSGDGGTTIVPDRLPQTEPVAVPVRQGGIVFMHRCTPHRSTPNLSNGVRWSIDLRYQPTGLPTGRPFHPEFEVRSESHQVEPNYDVWVQRWRDALEASRGARWHRV